MTDKQLTQTAPWPHQLEALVGRLRYRPGWLFRLEHIVRDPATTHDGEAAGLTFIVTTKGYDSYNQDRGETYRVQHFFPVPAATFNAQSWQRWLLECLLAVERHECCEFFAITLPGEYAPVAPGALHRPYAPTHGPGDDPYVIHEYATDEQRRTRFTGEVLD